MKKRDRGLLYPFGIQRIRHDISSNSEKINLSKHILTGITFYACVIATQSSLHTSIHDIPYDNGLEFELRPGSVGP
jgi:hypothetical protein